MSKLEVDTIAPQSGTTLTVGESGDTVTIPTGATFDASNATTTLPATVVTTTGSQTLTNKSIDASQLTGTITPSDGTVTNDKVDASAAIAYSKLNLTGNIALADLSATGTPSASTYLRGDNSWGAVSSDYVRLVTVTPSGVGSVSIDGYFTSDYDYYEIIGYDIYAASNGTLRGKVNVSGTSQGSDYDWSYIVSYVSSSASGGANNNGGAWKGVDFRIHYNNYGTTIADAGYCRIQIFNPLSTSSYKQLMFQGRSSSSGSGEVGTTYGGVRWASTSAISGVTLFPNLGNYGSGTTFILYGVK